MKKLARGWKNLRIEKRNYNTRFIKIQECLAEKYGLLKKEIYTYTHNKKMKI